MTHCYRLIKDNSEQYIIIITDESSNTQVAAEFGSTTKLCTGYAHFSSTVKPDVDLAIKTLDIPDVIRYERETSEGHIKDLEHNFNARVTHDTLRRHGLG